MHYTKEILLLLLFCALDSHGYLSAKNIDSYKFQVGDVVIKKLKIPDTLFPFHTYTDPPKFAFLADVHLQDVYADLKNSDFKGVLNPVNGKFATIRTMEAQLNSTRLFNENYFAFHSALEDLMNKGIRFVVLPGDFTDDGQPMNVRALRKILRDYEDKYGMRFFITTGNHDPVQPFAVHGGKIDFMGQKGKPQALASSKDVFKDMDGDPIPVAITGQISHWGYKEIMDELGDYGFYPNKKDIFWTHPFMEFDYENYRFQNTKEVSILNNRGYEVDRTGHFLPDASYLVEPVEGVWLLAIDANVFHPDPLKAENGITQYRGNGIGFDQTILHKKYLLEWIKKIRVEAERRGKTLISFSHYPLVDFNDGTSDLIADLFGENTFQLGRVPESQTSQLYADAGLKVHFAGHMHINDTGVHKTVKGNTLFNIQVPSLAAYPAAYKTLSIKSNNVLEIETIELDEVKGMDSFFELYKVEHKTLQSQNSSSIWETSILSSKNFPEFTRHHLKELVRLRFLPQDWPMEFRNTLLKLNGQELFYWALLENDEDKRLFLEDNKMDGEKIKEFQIILKEHHIKWDIQKKWKGIDLINDFYLIKNGDQIALHHLDRHMIQTYHTLFELVPHQTNMAGFQNEFYLFSQIFIKLMNGEPSGWFSINLTNNILLDLKPSSTAFPTP